MVISNGDNKEKIFEHLVQKGLYGLDVNIDDKGSIVAGVNDDYFEVDKKIRVKQFNKQLFKRMDFESKIKTLMKIGHFPSLVACIIKKDKKKLYTFGHSNREKEEDAAVDTVYMMASISKSITATAVMKLVEMGLLNLDEDVNNYLRNDFKLRHPKYPNKKINLRMLLAHQSGLSTDSIRWNTLFSLLGNSRNFFKEYFIPGGCYYQNDVWTKKAPGKKAEYSSEGIDLAAYIVQKRLLDEGCELSFEEFCKNFIFNKLDMGNTFFNLSKYKLEQLAVPYLFNMGRYIPLPHYDIRIPGSGGARSSISDLSHYLIMHINGGMYNGNRLLSEESVVEMHRCQYPNGLKDNIKYGLGWYKIRGDNLGKPFVYGGHGGTVTGFRNVMRMHEESKVGVIFFYNCFQYMDFRERFRLVGKLERWARRKIEELLFEKAKEL